MSIHITCDDDFLGQRKECVDYYTIAPCFDYFNLSFR